MKTSPTSIALFVLALSAAGLAPAKPAKAATDKTEVGLSARDGYVISAGEVLVTRHGQTEKLLKAVVFDNGARLFPDGRIITKDGRVLTLGATQLVTLEGKLIEVPAPAVRKVKAKPRPATPAPGTAIHFATPAPATPRQHIRAGEGVQK